APMLDGPSGAAVGTGTRRRAVRVVDRVRRAGEVTVQVPDDAALGRLVERMRTGQERIGRDARTDGTDPVQTVTALREAASAGGTLDVVVIGPGGQPENRRVRPLSVDGGRVRMLDLDRDAELVVAVHRIHSAT